MSIVLRETLISQPMNVNIQGNSFHGQLYWSSYFYISPLGVLLVGHFMCRCKTGEPRSLSQFTG